MRPLLLTLAGLGLCLGASAQGPDWSYAQGPFASGYVFAAHPSGAVFSVGGDHLLISWDHGRTWSQRSAAPVAPHALHLLGGDEMLALGSTGVIRSHDLGRTWVSAGLDGVALQFLALDPNGPWYAAVGRQLYRSEDEGATWEPRPFDFPQMGERFLALAVTEDGSVVVTWGGDVANLSRSTDGGLSWEEVDALPFTRGNPLVRAADGALLLSSYDPTDGCGLPHPAEGVYESVDGGASWETIYSGAATGAARTTTGELIVGRPGGLFWDGPALPVSAVRSLVEAPDGTFFANTTAINLSCIDYFFSASASGAYRLEPGRDTWEQAGNEPAAVQALAMVGDELYAGSRTILHKSHEGAWTATGWNQEIVDLAVLDDGRVIAVGSEFEGAGFTDGSGHLLVGEYCASDCTVGAVERVAGTLFASVDNGLYLPEGTTGIYRSEDDGATWVQTLAGIGDVRVLAAGPGAIRYAGTRGDPWGGEPGEAVYRSEDDGQTWAPFAEGLTDTEVHALIAPSGNAVFAGTEDGVFLSTGGAWVADGLPGHTVYALAVAADGLLAGTDAGVFRRAGAAQWRRYGTGPSGLAVLSLLVTTFEGEELVVAGTEAGVYLSRPGLITTGSEGVAVPPGAPALLAPYPNPARAAVTITFELAQRAPVRLVVYDVLGREVAHLADGAFSPGRHVLPWRPEGLAGGTYFVTLEASDERATRSLVLLR